MLEDASEEAGLGHALATRTVGPNMRRGDADPLYLGMEMEVGMGAGLGSIEGDIVGFTD